MAYVAAASTFFRRRIPYEEALLERFYPNEYPQYVRRSFIGIPFLPSSESRSSRPKPQALASGVSSDRASLAVAKDDGEDRSPAVRARKGSEGERSPFVTGVDRNDHDSGKS